MGCVIRLQFIVVLCFGVLLCAGCARPPSLPRKAPALKAGELPTITVIAGGKESYWLDAKRGSLAAGKKLGAKIVWRVPSGNDLIKSQQEIMKDATENSHGIALAPLESTKMLQSVGNAARAGLAVVVFDRDVFTVQNKLSYVHNDDYATGVLAARGAARIYSSGGVKAVSSSEQPQVVLRTRSFEDTIRKEFLSMEVLDKSKNYTGSAAWIFAPDEVTARESASSPKSDIPASLPHPRIIAFGADAVLVQALQQGKISALISPDYYQMAYQSVKAILDYRALKYPPREIKIAPRVITKTSNQTNNQRSTR